MEAVPCLGSTRLASFAERRSEAVVAVQDLLAPFNYICELKGKEVRAAFIQAFNKVASNPPPIPVEMTRKLGGSG